MIVVIMATLFSSKLIKMFLVPSYFIQDFFRVDDILNTQYNYVIVLWKYRLLHHATSIFVISLILALFLI